MTHTTITVYSTYSGALRVCWRICIYSPTLSSQWCVLTSSVSFLKFFSFLSYCQTPVCHSSMLLISLSPAAFFLMLNLQLFTCPVLKIDNQSRIRTHKKDQITTVDWGHSVPHLSFSHSQKKETICCMWAIQEFL